MTDQIWSSLMAATNNNPIQSAGIMGNIGIESSFNPEIVNQNENAFGLLQLRNDRLDNFRKFQEANPEMNLVDQQIRYIFEQGNPDSPYKDPIAAKYFERIMNQNDPMSIARLFDKRFERSAGWLVDPNNPSMGYNEFGTTTRDRMNLANDIYNYYTTQQNNLGETGQTNMQPKNKSLIGRFRDLMTDPDFSDDLRLWANSMRLRPDQNLALGIMEQKKAREAKRLAALAKTTSMKYLANIPDGTQRDMYSAMIAAGTELKDVLKMHQDHQKQVLDTQFKLEDNFKKEEPVKNFIKRADQLRTIVSSSQEVSQAGDIAVVFTFMKMLDPTSTVNKGELALAQNTGNLFQRGWSVYNALVTGRSSMTKEQRQGLVNAAFDIYNENKTAYNRTVDFYKERSNIYADQGFPVNPDQFLQKYGLSDEQYESVDTILEGYDPSVDFRNQEIDDVNLPFTLKTTEQDTRKEINFDLLREYLVENMPEQLRLMGSDMSIDEWINKNFDQLSKSQKFDFFKDLYLQTMRDANSNFNVNLFLR
tara:strand:- start:4059 stop:5660 length:1602 start_codon:yes stop_codon:yes gene_type:complete